MKKFVLHLVHFVVYALELLFRKITHSDQQTTVPGKNRQTSDEEASDRKDTTWE